QASDARRALEETMALSTQSLASVTYQVSSLASAFLRLLDLQAAELRQLEATVGCVAQRVDMHKEKVSRREIGPLTTSKRFPSHQKIVAPPGPPCLEPYCRRPLSFSALDDVGHGVKVSGGTWGLSGPPVSPGRPWGCARGLSPTVMGQGGPSVSCSQDAAPRPRAWGGDTVTGGKGKPRCTALTGTTGAGGLSCPPTVLLPPPKAPAQEGTRGGLGSLGGTGPRETTGGSGSDGAAVPTVAAASGPPPHPAPAAPSARLLPRVTGTSGCCSHGVVALYPYTRQKDNELSLAPGALLFVTRRCSDGWCEGVMGEETGFFPANYVEPF
ncbi:ABI3 protein, partial [Columbina picui]|nr:ABI3 protein [Columbina picui]